MLYLQPRKCSILFYFLTDMAKYFEMGFQELIDVYLKENSVTPGVSTEVETCVSMYTHTL